MSARDEARRMLTEAEEAHRAARAAFQAYGEELEAKYAGPDRIERYFLLPTYGVGLRHLLLCERCRLADLERRVVDARLALEHAQREAREMIAREEAERIQDYTPAEVADWLRWRVSLDAVTRYGPNPRTGGPRRRSDDPLHLLMDRAAEVIEELAASATAEVVHG